MRLPVRMPVRMPLGMPIRLPRATALLIAGALLLSVACGKTVSRDVLGPVSLAVAVNPEPTEPGPVVVYVQISNAEGTRPQGDAMIDAFAGPPGGALAPAVVVPVATPGASEVRVTMPPEGALRIQLNVRAQSGPVGQITYDLKTGQKGVVKVPQG